MTEKYRELYELSKYIYEEELGRAHRFDDKASKLLPAYAILIGLLGLIIKWFFDNGLPLRSYFDYGIALLLLITTISLIVSLWATIRVFTKAHNFNKVPLDDSLLKFFSDNRLIDIHFALSKRLKEAYEKNFVTTNNKAALFANVYIPTIASSVLLFLSLVLIGVNINCVRNAENKNKGETAMADDSKPTQPTDQTTQSEATPNPDVEAPPLRIVTESYKPPKDEIRKTIVTENKDKPKK